MKTLLPILALVFIFQLGEPTVAVIPTDGAPAIIMQKSEAESEFAKLCADGTDDKKLRALAAALNPMPDWPQFVLNNESSVCNRNPKPLPTPKGDK